MIHYLVHYMARNVKILNRVSRFPLAAIKQRVRTYIYVQSLLFLAIFLNIRRKACVVKLNVCERVGGGGQGWNLQLRIKEIRWQALLIMSEDGTK